MTCNLCGGPLMLLGKLGNTMHYRCRNCGADCHDAALPNDAPPNEALAFWEEQGFTVTGTGGGCEALERQWGAGFIWVTAAEDPSTPVTLAEPVAVGWYDANGDNIKLVDAPNSFVAKVLISLEDL